MTRSDRRNEFQGVVRHGAQRTWGNAGLFYVRSKTAEVAPIRKICIACRSQEQYLNKKCKACNEDKK